MASVLVTGANGFVGRALCNRLELIGQRVKRVVRIANSPNEIAIGNIGPAMDWRPTLLADCDSIIHLAARVHIMHDSASDPLTEFRLVNTEGTLSLACQAASSGIKRFVFLSSLKVNGENGTFSADSEPSPQDMYAISKWEAECGLREISKQTGMEVVVLRPPLVYGPGVGANFLRLIHAVNGEVPLPFGSVSNCRSLIYVGNLIDAIISCLHHPAASGKTYLVSDNQDISTADLIRSLALALNRSPRLLHFPPSLIKLIGSLLGKRKEMDRLLGSLVIDSKTICNDIGWSPPFSLHEGLADTITWYRHTHPQ